MLDASSMLDKLTQIGFDGSGPEDEKIRQSLTAIIVTLNEYNLSEDGLEVVLEVLSKQGREKLNNLPELQEDSWEDFNLGNVPVGSYVRVKKDAYDSETGVLHNGLVGIMTRMFGGKVTVNYIGMAAGKTMQHPVSKLDSLKLGVY